VDHLERAVADLGQRWDSLAQRAIATARSLAVEMTKGMAAVVDEERHVSDEIDGLVQTTHERASRKP
jgi:RES domain-containing protein